VLVIVIVLVPFASFDRLGSKIDYDLRVGVNLSLQFGHLERVTRGDLCPEGGYRAQPRVSTLGTLKLNEFALKLKGREADLIKLAPIATPKISVRN
jgi:hypothetical protein